MEDVEKQRIGWCSWAINLGWGAILLIFVFAVPLYIAPAIQQVGSRKNMTMVTDSTLLEQKAIRRNMMALNTEVERLEKRLNQFLPQSAYIVINTTKNRFYLYKQNGDLLREGFCSSGSYIKLVSEKRSWVFKTPKGRMTILSKTQNPVWAKPDWAFVEEGLPVPRAGDPSRFERGVLGDYALRMADGYLIHGTLYQRLLGMPVTHGCIRLGDEDLEVVFRALPVGAYVYIY